MIGWWADETKGYRLKNIDTRELVTSRDVCFIEDETPSDLVVFGDSVADKPAPAGLALVVVAQISDGPNKGGI